MSTKYNSIQKCCPSANYTNTKYTNHQQSLYHTVPFVVMNGSLKLFDGFDHQNFPKDHLEQIHAQTISTISEQHMNLFAYAQGHKKYPWYNVHSLVCIFIGSSDLINNAKK